MTGQIYIHNFAFDFFLLMFLLLTFIKLSTSLPYLLMVIYSLFKLSYIVTKVGFLFHLLIAPSLLWFLSVALFLILSVTEINFLKIFRLHLVFIVLTLCPVISAILAYEERDINKDYDRTKLKLDSFYNIILQ